MRDEWSKKLPDGRQADYTMDISPGVGGVITKKVGDIIITEASVPASISSMTREEVEERLAEASGRAAE